MQEPKASNSRKPWYQRAMEIVGRTPQWKTTPKSTEFKIPTNHPNGAFNSKGNHEFSRSIGNNNNNNNSHKQNNNNNKMRKCTSLKIATSFTRVCLCAPISSYNEIFQAEINPPRRSHSYPRSKPFPINNNNIAQQERAHFPSARASGESSSRRFFRGKSLSDDVLMRRFVVEEEAMMQVRRRNQMEVIRKRSLIMRRRKKLGPSPLSKMVIAEEEH